jgi:hypothetical protein
MPWSPLVADAVAASRGAPLYHRFHEAAGEHREAKERGQVAALAGPVVADAAKV